MNLLKSVIIAIALVSVTALLLQDRSVPIKLIPKEEPKLDDDITILLYDGPENPGLFVYSWEKRWKVGLFKRKDFVRDDLHDSDMYVVAFWHDRRKYYSDYSLVYNTKCIWLFLQTPLGKKNYFRVYNYPLLRLGLPDINELELVND